MTLLDSKTKYPFFEDVVIGIDSSGFFPKDIIGFEYSTREGRLVDQPDAISTFLRKRQINGNKYTRYLQTECEKYG